VESNPLELLEDGNVQLNFGKCSPLPLDHKIEIKKGQRRGMYIRVSVVFNIIVVNIGETK
jgi:hypothetical protein